MEDDAPVPKSQLLSAPSLDRLGVAELQAYAMALHAEITRVEAEIVRKETLRAAADSFFRQP